MREVSFDITNISLCCSDVLKELTESCFAPKQVFFTFDIRMNRALTPYRRQKEPKQSAAYINPCAFALRILVFPQLVSLDVSKCVRCELPNCLRNILFLVLKDQWWRDGFSLKSGVEIPALVFTRALNFSWIGVKALRKPVIWDSGKSELRSSPSRLIEGASLDFADTWPQLARPFTLNIYWCHWSGGAQTKCLRAGFYFILRLLYFHASVVLSPWNPPRFFMSKLILCLTRCMLACLFESWM